MKKSGFIIVLILIIRTSFAQDFESTLAKAKQGDADAQNGIGIMYEKGNGVDENHEKAAYWYEKSAELGDAVAQFNIGVMYDVGSGVAKSRKKAIYWYKKSAEQGYAAAQENLLLMY